MEIQYSTMQKYNLKKKPSKPFDWSIINIFGTWGQLPNIEEA